MYVCIIVVSYLLNTVAPLITTTRLSQPYYRCKQCHYKLYTILDIISSANTLAFEQCCMYICSIKDSLGGVSEITSPYNIATGYANTLAVNIST